MNSLTKNILSLAVLAGIVLLAFWYVSRAPEAGLAHIDVADGTATSSNPADQFASLLADLSVVNFQGDNSIFSNPIFQTGLLSFRRDLPQIDRARTNPFAPLEGNTAGYIHYLAPLPKSLEASTTTFPAATTTGTKSTSTTKK